MELNLTWRAEPDGRHWTAIDGDRQPGEVVQLVDPDGTPFWQGHCMRMPRYGWLTRPCRSVEEAQGELVAMLLGKREKWVRPDTRFKRKVPNRPEPHPHPGRPRRPPR